jgi:hypothetical protein
VYIINNEKLIKNRTTWSGRLTLLGIGLIVASGVLTFLGQATMQTILISYAALFGGFIIFNIGAASGAKWRLPPRPDQALGRSLKGLDHRYRLYNYLLPAEHVLLTPLGITVLQVRRMPGVVTNTGDKWYQKRSLLSRLRFAAEEQLGNPTRDVQQDMAAMKQFLTQKLENDPVSVDGIPIEPLIVFNHPNVQLAVTDPVVPVIRAEDLKARMRQEAAQGMKLDQDAWNALADIFDEAEGAEEQAAPADAPAATRAKKRKAAKKE